MRKLTNSQIVPAANRGEAAFTANENFWTAPGRAGVAGYLPRKLADALVFHDIFGPARRVEQVVYSYDTPIAFKIDGVWLIPDVNYSVTTSTKHATHLHKLTGRKEYVPWDASAEEIERVVDGKMRYLPPANRNGVGRYVPGPNAEA